MPIQLEDTLADMDPMKTRQKWKSLLKKSSALQKLGFGGSRDNSIRLETQIVEQEEEELKQALQTIFLLFSTVSQV